MMIFAQQRTCVILFFLFLLVAIRPVHAQDGFSVEVRGGASIGAYDNAQTGVTMNPSLSLRGNVQYDVAQTVSVYAGLERSRFGCSGGFCDGADVSYTATGIALGLRYGSTRSGGPFGRVGAVYHSLSMEANQGAYEQRSSGGLGFEVGGGYAFAVTPSVYITPGVAYTRYGVESDNGASSPVVVIVSRIGVRYAF